MLNSKILCEFFSGVFYEVRFELQFNGETYWLIEQHIQTPPESIFRDTGEDEWQSHCSSLSDAIALLNRRKEELADWDDFLVERSYSLLHKTWQSSERVFARLLESQREQELSYRGQSLAIDLPQRLGREVCLVFQRYGSGQALVNRSTSIFS